MIKINDTKEIISRLKFISRVKAHQKIDVNNLTIHNISFLSSISRIMNQNNRNNKLIFIKNIINKSIEILNQYKIKKTVRDKLFVNNLVQDLIKSKIGIINLKITYKQDVKFVCDIDVICEHIDLTLYDLQENDIINLKTFTDKHLDTQSSEITQPKYQEV